MAYVRLSITTPRQGESAHVIEVMEKLAEAARATPGCILSYVLKPDDGTSAIARIAVYEDHVAADRLANTDPMLSLRAQLHMLIEPGHVEHAYTSVS